MFIEAKVKNILAKTKAGLESTKDDNPLKANLRKMIDDINKQYFGEPQSEKPQEQPQAQAQPQPQTDVRLSSTKQVKNRPFCFAYMNLF